MKIFVLWCGRWGPLHAGCAHRIGPGQSLLHIFGCRRPPKRKCPGLASA